MLSHPSTFNPASHTLTRFTGEPPASQLIRMIEDNYSLVNVRNDNGKSPLHVTVDLENEYLLSALLLFSPFLEIEDSFGFTPLMTAVKNGKESLVTILYRAGSDSNFPNRSGDTAVTLAKSVSSPSLLSILSQPASLSTSCRSADNIYRFDPPIALRASFTYQAESDTEISFAKGEVLFVQFYFQDVGWCHAEKLGSDLKGVAPLTTACFAQTSLSSELSSELFELVQRKESASRKVLNELSESQIAIRKILKIFQKPHF